MNKDWKQERCNTNLPPINVPEKPPGYGLLNDVRFCEYFNEKTKKCRIFRIQDGIKFTSYKCEQDKDCYYKRLRQKEEQIFALEEKLAWIKECIKNYLSEETIDNICPLPKYYKEWMRNVRNKVIGKIEE